MSAALTVPNAVAAIVLCVAGLAKLRAPGTAASALGVPTRLVRTFAVFELGLGLQALVWPSAAGCTLLALTYLALAALTLMLSRRSAACGCFGEGDVPASVPQSMLSGLLALIGAVTAVGGAHGAGWILGRGPGSAAVLIIGISGAVYGTVVAYSEIPLAWRAWSPP